MSLKIEFISDIKGFERVERALNQQKDILNETADALDKVNKAKLEMGKDFNATKGFEHIRTTAKDLEGLAASLETLTKTQSGMKGFMSSFSGFNSEISKFTKTALGTLSKQMGSQLKELKKEIEESSQLLTRKQAELEDATRRGDTTRKMRVQEEINSTMTEVHAKQSIYDRARSAFTRMAPRAATKAGVADIGILAQKSIPFLGPAMQGISMIPGMGGIMNGLKMMFGGTSGMITGGALAAGAGLYGWQKLLHTRAVETQQAQQYFGGIAEKAMQGSAGELIALTGQNSAIGQYNKGFANAITHGNGLQYAGLKLKELLTWAGTGFNSRATQAKMTQYFMEENQFETGMINKASQYMKQRAGALENIGARIGSTQANQLTNILGRNMRGLAGTGLGLAEAANKLNLYEYGNVTENLVAENNLLAKNPNMTIPLNQSYRFLANAKDRLKITAAAEQELFRRSSYGKPATQDLRKAMGAYNVSTTIARQGASDFIAHQSAQFLGKYTNFQDLSAMAGGVAGALAGNTAFTEYERVQIGTAAQSKIQSEMDRNNSLLSLGTEMALTGLGVTGQGSLVERAHLSRLIASGQVKKAARIVSQLSGGKTSYQEALTRLNKLPAQWLGTLEQISGVSKANQQIFAKEGESIVGGMLGNLGTFNAKGVVEAMAKTGFGGQVKAKEAPITKTTEAMRLKTAQAQREQLNLAYGQKFAEMLTGITKNGEHLPNLFNALTTSVGNYQEVLDQAVKNLNKPQEKEAAAKEVYNTRNSFLGSPR